MKSAFTLTLLLLTLATASVAAASGINLSWNDCGSSGTLNWSFACDKDTLLGAELIASYFPVAGTTGVSGVEFTFDIDANAGTLPDWWQFKNVGACRQTGLKTSVDFTAWPRFSACFDYWEGLGAGGIMSYAVGVDGQPSRARLLVVVAIGSKSWRGQDPDLEHYGVRLILNGTRTVGAGACGGCSIPVCIVLSRVTLKQPSGWGDFQLLNPAQRNYVTWQGGVVPGGCPAATPTRNTTWGSLKAQYR